MQTNRHTNRSTLALFIESKVSLQFKIHLEIYQMRQAWSSILAKRSSISTYPVYFKLPFPLNFLFPLVISPFSIIIWYFTGAAEFIDLTTDSLVTKILRRATRRDVYYFVVQTHWWSSTSAT